jgi:hypothetical protein
MLRNRLVVVSGIVALVLAAFGGAIVISGANAGPNDAPQTQNSGNGGPVYSRLGF